MEAKQNIVQAEFFLAGKKAETLSELMIDMAERVADGAQIKQTVRFLDSDGSLSAFVQAASRNKEQFNHARIFWMKTRVANPINTFMLGVRYRRLAREVRENREKALILARARLQDAVKNAEQIAVENDDRSFRLAQRAELHELHERAHAAHGVWLFIFEPNNILADSNKMISSLM